MDQMRVCGTADFECYPSSKLLQHRAQMMKKGF
jgi:hypothetical protein